MVFAGAAACAVPPKINAEAAIIAANTNFFIFMHSLIFCSLLKEAIQNPKPAMGKLAWERRALEQEMGVLSAFCCRVGFGFQEIGRRRDDPATGFMRQASVT